MSRLLLALVMAAGCRFPEKLERPAVYWEFGGMPCHKSVAMDAEGRLWIEGGCENGRKPMRRAGRMPDAERREVEAIIAELPAGSGILTQQQLDRLKDAFAHTTNFHAFETCPEYYSLRLYDTSGCRREWLSPVCEEPERRMQRMDDDDPNWASRYGECPSE